MSLTVPLVWRTRFRRRLQLVTAARTDVASLPLRALEGASDAEVTDGAVVSVVRQRGIDATDLTGFFAALGARVPHAILGGIDHHAVSVFLPSSDDALSLVHTLHDHFVHARDEHSVRA